MNLKVSDSLQTKKPAKTFFVHVTALKGVELKDGDKVEYSEEEGRKGLVATNVQVIG